MPRNLICGRKLLAFLLLVVVNIKTSKILKICNFNRGCEMEFHFSSFSQNGFSSLRIKFTNNS